jgi:MerR family mercuric resistance operon transcriptional regulator
MGLNASAARCEKARAMTAAHRDEVRRKIADLKRLERALSVLVDECRRDSWPECPIIDALSKSN